VSDVISIRRSENQPAFTRDELERLTQSHEGLVLENGALVWTGPKRRRIELFIGERELRADRVPLGAGEQALAAFASMARALNAQLVDEAGEALVGDSPQMEGPAPRWQLALGGVLTVLAIPFTLLLALVTLPWVLWKVGRKGK